MAYFGLPATKIFTGSVPSLRSPNTSPEDLWTLDEPQCPPRLITKNACGGTHEPSSSASPTLFGRITPEIYAASREIRALTRTLGAPLPTLYSNFVNYTNRVGVPVSTDNFIFYLRNWADLDLRIRVSKLDSALQMETLLKKVQSNNAGQSTKSMEQSPAKPITILKRPRHSNDKSPAYSPAPVKTDVRAVICNGTTYYEIEKPAVTKSGLSHEDLLKLKKVRFGSTSDIEKPIVKKKAKSELSPEEILRMKEEAKRVFAKKLADYYN